jgi:hypothetical protein
MTMGDYSSYLQNQNILTAANNDRTNAYNQAKLRGESEDRSQAAAKFAWQQRLDTAGLTGMFEGQYTMPTQMDFANMFGTWGTPTPGQQTLAGNQQAFGQGTTLAGLYGQYYAPGTAPGQGQQTLAGAEQGFTQGLRTQQEQRAAQAQQQSQAQQYLSLLASLRGPADWQKYQQVLGSTPGGMRDLYAAAMGQYVPGGGATTGVQPQAVSLQSLMGDVSGNPYSGQGGGQLNTPNVYGQNSAGMYQQQGGQPNVAAFTPQAAVSQATQPAANYQYSPSATGSQINQSGWAGANAQPTQAQNAQGNGTNMYGAQPQPQNQMNLPAPNQIAAQSWNNMAPSQQQMLLGGYEAQGWDKNDVQALMNQSLPKYGSNAATAGTWRLR